jgi:AcrR family transcriptional regulator
MSTRKTATPRPRTALSRERIVKAALAVVDKGGVEALSMRSVAAKLGVEAMSLYRHVADKDDLFLGVADLVLSEVEVPSPGTPWREAMRRRARSARAVFLRHPAAAIVVESCRTMSPARLAYADAIAGLLMSDGFDPTRAYRAFLLLDSYIYGFTMQELSWPRPSSPDEPPVQPAAPLAQYPHFAAMMEAAMSAVAVRGLAQSYADEFEFGLELTLDALARLRDA